MSRVRLARTRAPLAVWSAAVVLALSAGAESGSVLRVTGMTFVGGQEPAAELVLRSERALFHPDTDIAELEVVEAAFSDEGDRESFTMTCDRAELDVATNDFVAEGNVRGVTAEGQRYSAPVVHYDHEQGLLHSDRRVTLVDATGSFEGDGFRYLVREGSFELLGNVRVVQTP